MKEKQPKVIWRPVRIHTRKLDRGVARARMKQSGHKRVTKNGWFAANWRAFAE